MPLPLSFMTRAADIFTSAGLSVEASCGDQLYLFPATAPNSFPIQPGYEMRVIHDHYFPGRGGELHMLLTCRFLHSTTLQTFRKTSAFTEEWLQRAATEELATAPVVTACAEFIRDIWNGYYTQEHMPINIPGERQFRARVAELQHQQRTEVQVQRTRRATANGVARAQPTETEDSVDEVEVHQLPETPVTIPGIDPGSVRISLRAGRQGLRQQLEEEHIRAVEQGFVSGQPTAPLTGEAGMQDIDRAMRVMFDTGRFSASIREGNAVQVAVQSPDREDYIWSWPSAWENTISNILPVEKEEPWKPEPNAPLEDLGF